MKMKYQYVSPEELITLSPEKRKAIIENSWKILEEAEKDYPYFKEFSIVITMEDFERKMEAEAKAFRSLPFWKRLICYIFIWKIKAYNYLTV